MTVTKKMIGAAHDIMLQRGDFVISADLLTKIYEVMRSAEPIENRELLEQNLFRMQNAANDLAKKLEMAEAIIAADGALITGLREELAAMKGQS